ncbi:MAG TPA: selenocysteine-specific translation elongation factor [Pyrinomonadaceae bacterium]|nr:selenocysteine-specific translation elongation factor [Pyrinomonadaceae bacterium]
MKSIIVGTAGHIDHGKSALVRALTGMDPDRLPEEKRRGITIDLGFADLQLNDVRLGFVDVPGHERFVKNMLAGAHGIDLVALVIAADEGVMPQTREHFDICRLLGVRGGLVVITKADLVEQELIQLVREEAQELITESFLEGAPIVAVSAKTGAGLEELKATLHKLALQVPERSSELVPILPVDRAFTMKGFGPVVTGTLISGEITEGAELELLPVGLKARARGIQVHGEAVSRALAGQRTAINLGSVDASMIERGMVLAPAGRLEPIQIMDVHLNVLPGASRPIRSRTRVRFHLHTAEVLGRVRVIDDVGEIVPGESGLAQIRLESPVVAHVNQRFILRSYSPSMTVAGGEILNPFATKHRARDLARTRQTLIALKDATDRVSQFVIFVGQAKEYGQALAGIAARTGWSDEILVAAAQRAQATGAIINCDGVFISRGDFEGLCRMVMEEVQDHHKKEPLTRGLPRETLRERLFPYTPPEIFRAVLNRLELDGLLVAEREIVRAREHTLELSGEDAQLRGRLEQIFREAGLEPPSLEAALQTAAKSNLSRARRILQMMLDAGTVVRIQQDMLFDRKVLEGLIKKVRTFAENRGPERSIDVAAFKQLAGVSRKYAIPLLEYLDRERITMRQGDRRIINKPPG